MGTRRKSRELVLQMLFGIRERVADKARRRAFQRVLERIQIGAAGRGPIRQAGGNVLRGIQHGAGFVHMAEIGQDVKTGLPYHIV